MRTIGKKNKKIVRDLVKKAQSKNMTGAQEITEFVIEQIDGSILDKWEGAHDEVKCLVWDYVFE